MRLLQRCVQILLPLQRTVFSTESLCGLCQGSARPRLSSNSLLRASVAGMASLPQQRYQYFLVLDFKLRVTQHPFSPKVMDGRKPKRRCGSLQCICEEIIEFPILKLNGQTMEIESIFHTYVQPVYNPQLTPFCTQLTGIIQSMVEGQPTLQQALQMVAEWMDKENLLNPDVSSVFVTCGDWDLKTMLPGQCQHLGLQAPDYFKQWINLKRLKPVVQPLQCTCQQDIKLAMKAYSFAMGSWPKSGLPAMQEGLSLKQEGRLHSGIDDCRNIANIMKEMARRGFVFKQTSPRIET